MKKSIPLLLIIFFAVLTGFSQKTKPTPPPEKDDEVVKISTALIQVDVTVTDSKGNVVKDLKAEDFEIYENGQKQEITVFWFNAGQREKTAADKAPSDKIPVPVPAPGLRPEQVRRTIALVVDDLSLSFESIHSVRRALKSFVDEQMQEGDLVAIIRTGGGIGALQQFTSDKRQLYAAIEKVRWYPMGNGSVGAFAAIEPTPLEVLKSAGDTSISEEDLAAEARAIQALEDYRSSIFATGTLGALRFVVSGMNEMPGRKSVILFSDGFRIFQRNDEGLSETGRVLEFLRQLVDLANRSSVVFYTINARGLTPSGISAQDSILAPGAQRLQSILASRSAELFDTQQGLSYLAQETGGLAVRNSNDLGGGVRQILEDQSFYLIGYQPDSDTFDARTRRFNKLEVKIKRQDLKVRYRSGFFNVANENAAPKPSNRTPQQQITSALTSPFVVNDISLRLNALFGNNPAGSFVRSLLHVDARDLKFTDERDGTKKAVFDVLAMSFGDNGTPVDQIAKTYTLTVPSEFYLKLLKDGFVYHFTFPIKKPGAYQLRVAIRDSQGEKVGSANQLIEVPNLKNERLTVSGVVLENLTPEQWQKMAAGSTDIRNNQDGEAVGSTNVMNDTSLRRFRRGTILRYGFEVYNARLDTQKSPNLTARVRIFHDGKLLFEGNPIPVDRPAQTDWQRIKMGGAVSLAGRMAPGDYILQVIVTDNLAKEKHRIASQFVQFEIVE